MTIITPPGSASDLAKDQHDIQRGSTLSLLGFLARLCARVPFLFIAGRLYGSATYGEYVLLTAIVETTALLSTFGLKRTIFSFIQEGGEDKKNAAAIRHSLVIGLTLSFSLMALIQVMAMPVLDFFSASEAQTNLIILACAVPFISLTDILLSSTLSKRIMRYEIAVRCFVEPLSLTLFSLVFYLIGFRESGLILAFVFAYGLAAAVSAFGCFKVFGLRNILIGDLHVATLLHIARRSASTCLHDCTRVLITRIDIFAVGYFFSTSSVGLYGMARQFLTVIEKIALSFYPMLMPVVSTAVSNSDRKRLLEQLRSAGRRLVLLQLPVVLLFYFHGEYLLGLIGQEFIGSFQVLLILAAGCWINSVIQLVEIPLTYMRPSANVFCSLLALTVYLTSITVMKEKFGFNGIALTSVSATFLANVLLFSIFTRTELEPNDNRD
ncbi:MAG: oligosaccharide flippase family protein [Rhodospirillaceae bacterium]|nr:oligosaccharide flippase family protein [Rhodospirillaceae bacterium]